MKKIVEQAILEKLSEYNIKPDKLPFFYKMAMIRNDELKKVMEAILDDK